MGWHQNCLYSQPRCAFSLYRLPNHLTISRLFKHVQVWVFDSLYPFFAHSTYMLSCKYGALTQLAVENMQYLVWASMCIHPLWEPSTHAFSRRLVCLTAVLERMCGLHSLEIWTGYSWMTHISTVFAGMRVYALGRVWYLSVATVLLSTVTVGINLVCTYFHPNDHSGTGSCYISLDTGWDSLARLALYSAVSYKIPLHPAQWNCKQSVLLWSMSN